MIIQLKTISSYEQKILLTASRILFISLLLLINPLLRAQTKLTGTAIGTAGSWNNGANTKEKALDGNTGTFFDAPTANANDAWVGLDLGTAKTIGQVKYFPRTTWESRMVGGKFQGSNSAGFSSGVTDLFTITTQPADVYTSGTVTVSTPFRYVRYLTPAGGSCNVAEIEFYSSVGDTQAPSTPTGLGASVITQTSFTLSWAASTDNVGVAGYEVFRDGTSIGTPATNSFPVTGLAAGTSYNMTVRSRDAASNFSAQSTSLPVTTQSGTAAKLSGTAVGTAGSWNNGGNTKEKALDGNTGTFFDAPTANGNDAWVGLDLGSTKVITQVRYFPRATWESRMVGGKFQGSNTADFSSGVIDLFTVSAQPADVYTPATVSVATAFRYVRYLTPANGSCNVAEVEFYGTSGGGGGDTQAPSVPGGLGSSSLTSTSFTLSWTASTDNVGVTGYEVFRNGVSIATPTGTSVSVTGLAAATPYSMTVRSRDAASNFSAQSTALNVTTQTGSTPPTSTSNLMGINLEFDFTDYSEDRMFTDVMKVARRWALAGHNADDTGFPAPVDGNGWPTVDAETVIWAGIANMMGTYKLSFESNNPSGVVVTAGFAGATFSNRTVSGNTVSYNMVFTSTIPYGLTLAFTNTNGGVRNIKMYRPVTPGSATSYAAGTMFTNEIKALVNKFKVIRFMDFFHTNSNNQVNWSDRSLPADASMQRRRIGNISVGGCYEYAIQLCNETGRDMWLNVPLKADANYVTQLATLCKNLLDPSLKLYVEYSNEIWNTHPDFSQGPENIALANTEVQAGGSPLNFDGEPSMYYWAFRRPGKRIVEISNIFRSVFGDAAMMTRVRPLLMSQQGNFVTIEQPLQLIDRVYGTVNQYNAVAHPVNYYVYGCGGSGYYNPDNGNTSLTIGNIFSSLTMDVNNWFPTVKNESSYAHAFGLKRICYEGGPSFDKCNCSADAVKDQAWGNAQMTPNLVSHINNAWNATDGDLFVYYRSTGDYQWACTHDIFNLSTPKLQAIDQLNGQTKTAVTIGNVPPTTLTGVSNDLAFGNSGYTVGTSRHMKTNTYVSYNFRVTTAGTYNAFATVTGNSGPLYIILDGIYRGTVTTSGNTPGYTMSNLQPGLHTVMLKTTTGEVEVNSVTINTGAGTQSTMRPQTALPGTGETTAMTEGLVVYPNPVTGSVVKSMFYSATRQKAGIFLSSPASAEPLVDRRATFSPGNNSIEVPVARLASGVYFLTIKAESKTVTTKVIIIH